MGNRGILGEEIDQALGLSVPKPRCETPDDYLEDPAAAFSRAAAALSPPGDLLPVPFGQTVSTSPKE